MSESVKAQVSFLLELKRIDDQAYRIQVGLKQLPAEIAKVEAEEKQHEEIFAAARSAVADAEKKLRSTEQELKSKEDELFKAEGRMMDVKTNAEYLAATKENETRKAAKGILEERVLKLMDQLEAQRTVLKGLEKENSTEKDRLVAAKKTLVDQKAQLESEYSQIAAKRETHGLQLDAPVLAMYRKSLADGRRSAIAYAHNGQCGSCNMQVRPQMYNEVIGFVKIHQCGHCRNILIPNQAAPTSAAEDTSAVSR